MWLGGVGEKVCEDQVQGAAPTMLKIAKSTRTEGRKEGVPGRGGGSESSEDGQRTRVVEDDG